MKIFLLVAVFAIFTTSIFAATTKNNNAKKAKVTTEMYKTITVKKHISKNQIKNKKYVLTFTDDCGTQNFGEVGNLPLSDALNLINFFYLMDNLFGCA